MGPRKWLGIDDGIAEFKRQGDNYHSLCKSLLADGGPVSKVTKTAQIVGVSFAFAEACFGFAAIANVFTGIAAQRALKEFYSKAGKDISNISKDLDILVTHKNQHKFGRHVFDLLKMRTQQLEVAETLTGRKQYTFVYQHGNEWHGLFNNLFSQENERSQNSAWLAISWACITAFLSILWANISNLGNSTKIHPPKVETWIEMRSPRFIGVYDNLNTLTAAMQIIRKVVGPDAEFHVLLPATELTMINEPLAFPPEVHPIFLEGELHTGTGQPYYHLNMPGASSEMFRHVRNLAEPELKESGPSFGRKAAEVSAEVGAGIGGGIAGCAAGFLAVGIGAVVFFPLAAPVAVGVACIGAMAGGGVAAGTASAISAGQAVKESFEKSDWDAKMERARKVNALTKKR